MDTREDRCQSQVEEYITDNNRDWKERQEENLTTLVNNNSSGINYLAVYVKIDSISYKIFIHFYIYLRWDTL